MKNRKDIEEKKEKNKEQFKEVLKELIDSSKKNN